MNTNITECEDVDWFHLAQDNVQKQAVGLHKQKGIFWTAEQLEGSSRVFLLESVTDRPERDGPSHRDHCRPRARVELGAALYCHVVTAVLWTLDLQTASTERLTDLKPRKICELWVADHVLGTNNSPSAKTRLLCSTGGTVTLLSHSCRSRRHWVACTEDLVSACWTMICSSEHNYFAEHCRTVVRPSFENGRTDTDGSGARNAAGSTVVCPTALPSHVHTKIWQQRYILASAVQLVTSQTVETRDHHIPEGLECNPQLLVTSAGWILLTFLFPLIQVSFPYKRVATVTDFINVNCLCLHTSLSRSERSAAPSSFTALAVGCLSSQMRLGLRHCSQPNTGTIFWPHIRHDKHLRNDHDHIPISFNDPYNLMAETALFSNTKRSQTLLVSIFRLIPHSWDESY